MDFLPHLLPPSPWADCSQIEKWLEFFIFKKVNKAIACILKTKARLLREAYLNTPVQVTSPELP